MTLANHDATRKWRRPVTLGFSGSADQIYIPPRQSISIARTLSKFSLSLKPRVKLEPRAAATKRSIRESKQKNPDLAIGASL
jgi:hypothetical protein